MRITFVLPSLGMAGGVRVVALYAQHLEALGHTVTTVARPEYQRHLRGRIEVFLRKVGIFPRLRNHFDDMGQPYRLLPKFRPVEDRDLPDADVIVATWWETVEWLTKLSPTKGKTVYFVQHHEVFPYTPKERVEATYRLPIPKICIAGWLVDLMASQYGDTTAKLVPNAVDLEQFSAPPRGRRPAPTVGFLYAYEDWKGVDIILKAVEILRQTLPDLKIVCFGSKPVAAPLLLPEGTDFRLQPTPDTIRNSYAACDVWLFGSRCEGFGLPILEAMACRTPVVGTPTGAAPDLLPGGNGVLLNSFEPEEMARETLRVLQLSEEEWKGLSDRAYRKAAGYTWKDATRLFEAALVEFSRP